MARTLNQLKPIALSKKMPRGYHSDGGGLYLQVTRAGAKSWIYPTYRNFAQRCLQDRGYDVIGWQ